MKTLLNNIKSIIHKIFYKIKNESITFFNNILLFYKKNKTIKTMYKPILDDKIHKKEQLSKKLYELNKKDSNLSKQLQIIAQENLYLKNNIDTLLNLIILDNKR